MDIPVTVDAPGIRVPASEVMAGDKCFDIFGYEHHFTKVVNFKHVTRTYREDGCVETWPNDMTVRVSR